MDTEAEFLVKGFFAPNLPILARDALSERVGCEHGLHSFAGPIRTETTVETTKYTIGHEDVKSTSFRVAGTVAPFRNKRSGHRVKHLLAGFKQRIGVIARPPVGRMQKICER